MDAIAEIVGSPEGLSAPAAPEGPRRIRIVGSHTGGEPTRTILAGGPELGPGSAAHRLEILRRDRDELRTAVIGEPRGSDVLVGALLLPPSSPEFVAQVIFFESDELCETSYKDRKGKYQGQQGVTLPKA